MRWCAYQIGLDCIPSYILNYIFEWIKILTWWLQITGKAGSVQTRTTEYTGFTTPSATSGQHEKGQFNHIGLTSINISHGIYHMFPLRVSTMPPSKAHTSSEPHIHSDHYCMCGCIVHIAHTNLHTLMHTQWEPLLNYPFNVFKIHGMHRIFEILKI